jgi:hypothetical protein
MGCANDSSNAPPSPKVNKGEKLKPVDAVAVLTGTARWCYDNTSNDALFATHSFHKDGSGDYTICHHAKKSCNAPIPMKWKVVDDTLTMILPKKFNPNVWTAQLRFLNGTVQLWEDDNTLKSVLVNCNQ